MRRIAVLSLVVLAAACGGSGSGPVVTGALPAVASDTEAVEKFMAAVADSNVARMGELWGTMRGPAAATGQPANWQRRMVVAQLYLRGGSYRISSNVSSGDGRRELTLDLDRGGCTSQVPFTVARLATGSWVVVNLDVSKAGNPARPCGDD